MLLSKVTCSSLIAGSQKCWILVVNKTIHALVILKSCFLGMKRLFLFLVSGVMCSTIYICVCKLLCLSALGAHAHFRVCEWLDPWSSSGSAHSSHPWKVAPPIRRRSDAWRAVSAFTHLCWHGGRHSGIHQWNTFWCQVGTSCSQPLNKSLTQCQFISYCWCTILYFSIWLMIIVQPSAWKDQQFVIVLFETLLLLNVQQIIHTINYT